jgi:two-component system, NarL family, nitrate/nitrite response regulator NarL
VSGEQLARAPIRIFIIDDHPTIIWGLERLIESEQPRMVMVGKATGFASAMLLMEQAQPDVVLLDLDLGLGKENGLDSIPEILKKSTAKILVLTGVRDTSAHEAAIRAGALGVVGKEIASAELLQAIERVHRGELSVDRKTTERLLATISRKPATVGVSSEEERMASLTARERDIVLSLTRQPQLPLKEVAGSLGISERTLRNHLSSIYEKLGVSGRLELYVVSSKQTADKYKQ